MRGVALLLLFATACGPGHAKSPTPTVAGFREQFLDASLSPDWVAMTPNVAGAGVRVQRGELMLTLPTGSDGAITVKRTFDASSVRGARMRLTVGVRTDAPAASLARAGLTITTPGALPTYTDLASTQAVNSASRVELHAVIDVAPSALTGELELVLNGSGSAWFDSVELVEVGPSPTPVAVARSPRQLTNVMAFTHAATAIRYLHPSDQSAALDWDRFIPAAIHRVLDARSQAELLSELRVVFAPIAPTATFSASAERLPPPAAPVGATHLARWHHHGLGPSVPFGDYREGRDVDPSSAAVSLRVPIASAEPCKSFSVHATGHRLAGSGEGVLYAKRLGPVSSSQNTEQPFTTDPADIVLSADVAADVREIEVGFRVRGPSGLSLTALTLSCDGGRSRSLDLTSDAWTFSGFVDLYTWERTKAAAPSFILRRNPLDTSFEPARDLSTISLGDGLQLHVPLAVWTDDSRTLPATSAPPLPGDHAIIDLPLRLATISAAWGTLSTFYPYFEDAHIDWLAALPAALAEAAAARSPSDLHTALAHLLVGLHDNHARITHAAAPATGILPIMLRRFGDKIIVVGGMPEHLTGFAIGSELIEINGVPAIHAYDGTASQASSATPGIRDYLAALRLGMTATGTFQRLRFRNADGTDVARVLPTVDLELYAHAVREAHPKPGTELAPGVYYVDVDELPLDAWLKLVPTLEGARVIILDFRGYVTRTTLDVISHIATHEVDSPIWEIPRVPRFGGAKYYTSHWGVRPQVPRLTAKILVLIDSRAMSAAETALQILHDNQLATFIGENSGGTNGNVATATTPGGFEIFFTGMRASGPDGSTIQGHGIVPDQVVHPTLEGARAGRDEILEAAVAAAQRLVPP